MASSNAQSNNPYPPFPSLSANPRPSRSGGNREMLTPNWSYRPKSRLSGRISQGCLYKTSGRTPSAAITAFDQDVILPVNMHILLFKHASPREFHLLGYTVARLSTSAAESCSPGEVIPAPAGRRNGARPQQGGASQRRRTAPQGLRPHASRVPSGRCGQMSHGTPRGPGDSAEKPFLLPRQFGCG